MIMMKYKEQHRRYSTLSIPVSQYFTLLLIIFTFKTASSLDWGSCNLPLGMESGDIADEDITSTTSHDVKSVGPQNARLNKEKEAGAWCPRKPVTNEAKEYIEINLKELKVISAVATQGRWDNGIGVEYTEWYMITYWRSELSDWVKYRNKTQHYIFKGNTNTYSVVKQHLVPPIIANRIRIIPYTIYSRVSCLRLEIYGCAWTDGVSSYTIPRGYHWKTGVDLGDSSYDGVIGDSHYYNGLGQLTDGQIGTENLQLQTQNYEWVGWKNNTSHKIKLLEMVFQFDKVRNFSSVIFHISNAYKSGVMIFSDAIISFSIDGKYYNSKKLTYNYMTENFIEYSRNVTIKLKHHIGKYVKIAMVYASKWILISEISFDSEVVSGNVNEENWSLKPHSGKPIQLLTEGIAAYRIPVGSKWKDGIVLTDNSYDGIKDGNHLDNGIGLLMDGKYGGYLPDLEKEGNMWIGWKNESNHQIKILELLFKFEALRNFSLITFHVNNDYKNEILVFSEAIISFSIGGKYFNSDKITYKYMPDTYTKHSRYIKIKLKNHIGRYLKVSLRYAAKWILLSEVQIQSRHVKGNISDESGNFIFPSDSDPPGTLPSLPPVREKTEVSGQLMGVIIVVMVAFIVLLIIVIVIIVLRFKSRKLTSHTVLHPAEKQFTNGIKELRMNMHFVPKMTTQQNMGDVQLSSSDGMEKDIYDQPHNINPIVNASFKRNGTLDSTNGCCNHPYADSTTSGDYAEPEMSSGTIILNGSNSNGVQVTSNAPSLSPPVPPTPASLISFLPNGITTCHTSSSPHLHHHNISYSPKPSPQHNLTSKPSITLPSPASFSPSLSDHYYASTDLIKPNGLQGVCGTNVYTRSNLSDPKFKDDQPLVIPEFPRDRLNFIAKIGEGQYGEIHLCKAEVIPDKHGQVEIKLFAVKAMRPLVPERARTEFWREAKILSCLQDDNLVRVLGACTQEDPPLLLLEYGENGNLKTFLENNEITTNFSISIDENAKLINYGTLIYMATQIASGMNHLESINFIHRDLAARNCLVGNGFSIKISDFAMSNEKFKEDYFSMDGGNVVIPIRWMAWESVLLGKYSSKSDVWSFAVTFWEILMCGKTRPFQEQADESVLENMKHYQNNGFYSRLGVFLPQPTSCPKEIYDLMCECWQWREGDRPNFREIQMFLQRKNLGYTPSQK